jgi:hypothetical protein
MIKVESKVVLNSEQDVCQNSSLPLASQYASERTVIRFAVQFD